MARKISLNDFGKNPLRPEHIDGDTTVLTIQSVEEAAFDGRKQLEIRFAEFPEHQFFTNVSILSVLIAMLGDDLDSWIGQRIPLEKITVPMPRDTMIGGAMVRKGTPIPKLYPVDAAEWVAIIGEFDKAVADSKKSAAKPARKARG